MKTSLRLKNGEEFEQDIKMEKAPTGPPKWTSRKRRPHEYEDIKQAMESEGRRDLEKTKEAGATPHPAVLSSKSMSDLDVPDMAWDESDLRNSNSSKRNLGASVSQPNLLASNLEDAFPHLVRPERVSEQVFQLRKLRLLQHKYEDVDISEWPELGPVGATDVAALTSAIRSSWLDNEVIETGEGEGGEKEKLPKGWKIMTDEVGNRYYWHLPSGKTQYTKPTGEEIRRLVSFVMVYALITPLGN